MISNLNYSIIYIIVLLFVIFLNLRVYCNSYIELSTCLNFSKETGIGGYWAKIKLHNIKFQSDNNILRIITSQFI